MNSDAKRTTHADLEPRNLAELLGSLHDMVAQARTLAEKKTCLLDRKELLFLVDELTAGFLLLPSLSAGAPQSTTPKAAAPNAAANTAASIPGLGGATLPAALAGNTPSSQSPDHEFVELHTLQAQILELRGENTVLRAKNSQLAFEIEAQNMAHVAALSQAQAEAAHNVSASASASASAPADVSAEAGIGQKKTGTTIEAQQILTTAQLQAIALRAEADEYCLQQLTEMQRLLGTLTGQINGGIAVLHQRKAQHG